MSDEYMCPEKFLARQSEEGVEDVYEYFEEAITQQCCPDGLLIPRDHEAPRAGFPLCKGGLRGIFMGEMIASVQFRNRTTLITQSQKFSGNLCRKGTALILTLAMALIMAMWVSGCAAPPQTKLYVLSGVAAESVPTAGKTKTAVSIGLGPVTLPEYLDRPQIVIRASENRLEAADLQRWAEPLAGNITRVLAEDLSALLDAPRILLFPWNKSEAPDYQVRVEILRFEAGPGDAMHCIATWSVTGRDEPAGNAPLRTAPPRRSVITIPAPLGDFDAMTKAASEALLHVSREIVEELRRII